MSVTLFLFYLYLLKAVVCIISLPEEPALSMDLTRKGTPEIAPVKLVSLKLFWLTELNECQVTKPKPSTNGKLVWCFHPILHHNFLQEFLISPSFVDIMVDILMEWVIYLGRNTTRFHKCKCLIQHMYCLPDLFNTTLNNLKISSAKECYGFGSNGSKSTRSAQFEM